MVASKHNVPTNMSEQWRENIAEHIEHIHQFIINVSISFSVASLTQSNSNSRACACTCQESISDNVFICSGFVGKQKPLTITVVILFRFEFQSLKCNLKHLSNNWDSGQFDLCSSREFSQEFANCRIRRRRLRPSVSATLQLSVH